MTAAIWILPSYLTFIAIGKAQLAIETVSTAASHCCLDINRACKAYNPSRL